MPFRTRGEIKQAIMDMFGSPGDLALDTRFLRILDNQIDMADAALLGANTWDCAYDFVQLPITATTDRLTLWTEGVGGITTITDVNGNPAPYIANILHVRLLSTGAALGHNDKIRQSFLYGEYSYTLRRTPSTWDAIGPWLFLDPLPGGSDTVECFVMKGHMPLPNDAAVPFLPPHLRDYYVLYAMTNLWSTDGADVRKQAWARQLKQERIAALMQYEHTAQPGLKAIPLMPQSTNL